MSPTAGRVGWVLSTSCKEEEEEEEEEEDLVVGSREWWKRLRCHEDAASGVDDGEVV